MSKLIDKCQKFMSNCDNWINSYVTIDSFNKRMNLIKRISQIVY